MTKRTSRQQTKHDKKVEKIKKYYEFQGYSVSADLKNEKTPKKIEGKIPDVVARKNGKEVIVEVETKDSDKKDKHQQDVFKNYADKSKNRRFRKVIAK